MSAQGLIEKLREVIGRILSDNKIAKQLDLDRMISNEEYLQRTRSLSVYKILKKYFDMDLQNAFLKAKGEPKYYNILRRYMSLLLYILAAGIQRNVFEYEKCLFLFIEQTSDEEFQSFMRKLQVGAPASLAFGLIYTLDLSKVSLKF